MHFIRLTMCIVYLGLTNLCDAQTQPFFINKSEVAGIAPCPPYPEGHGVVAADYDNDGDIDLFVPTDDQVRNHLYVNQGEGTFIEMAETVGLGEPLKARVALWIDYDADHLLDLIVVGDCRLEPNDCEDRDVIRLYKQLSDHTFEEVTEKSGLLHGFRLDHVIHAGGAAAGDLNNDGYPELMINYWIGHAYLFANNQDGTFREIGLEKLSGEKNNYLQPIIYDINNDNLNDLILAVDGSKNEVWINKGDYVFENLADTLLLASDHSDMGVTIGDLDNDGDLDIYMTNVSGNNSHNQLFRNEQSQGSLVFTEVAREYHVDQGGWGWGTTFFDANNDGYLDLAESNGWYDVSFRMPSRFWLNNGAGFTDLSREVGLTEIMDANALLAADYDRDGDLDLMETSRWTSTDNTAVRILQNQLQENGSDQNYLVIKPRMMGANHHALGATVKVHVAQQQLTRPILAGTSYYAQEPYEAFFGLGSSEKVDQVVIGWPGGAETTIEDVMANQVLVVTDENTLHTPTNLRLHHTDFTTVYFAWDHQSSSESHFEIIRSDNSKFENAHVFSLDKTQKWCLDTGLTTGQTYHYQVRAASDDAVGQLSKSIQLTPQEYLVPPANLIVDTSSPFSLTLNWQDESDNEENFIIERSTDSEFSERHADTRADTVAANSITYSDDAVTPNTTYYYRLKGVKQASHSAYTPILKTITPDFIPAPSSLVKWVEGTTIVRLEWEDHSDNESGFFIEKSLTDQFLHYTTFKVGKNVTFYRDKDAFPGTTFYYRVKAYNQNTESAYITTSMLLVTGDKGAIDKRLTVYPNPSENFLHIEFPTDMQARPHTISIYNPTGKQVLTKRIRSPQGTITIDYGLQLAPGLYILRVGEESTKIVIQ